MTARLLAHVPERNIIEWYPALYLFLNPVFIIIDNFLFPNKINNYGSMV